MMGECGVCSKAVQIRPATKQELQALAEKMGCENSEQMVFVFGEAFEYICEDHGGCSGGLQPPRMIYIN